MLKNRKSNITFIIFHVKDKRGFEYPIQCFSPYGKIIILDMGSTDRTFSIAKKLHAKVISSKFNYSFSETKEETDFILKQVKTDWVFWGYADEMVPKTCLELYKKISHDPRYKIVIQRRKTMQYRKMHDYFPVYTQIKFFRKDALDFTDNKIHQMGRIAKHVKPSEILFLPQIDEYSIYHYSSHTSKTVINNFNIYTDTEAQDIKPNKIASYLLLRPITGFISLYFIQKSFRYGLEGLIVAVENSFYQFLLGAKAYEKYTHNNNSENIEKEFLKSKKMLLIKSPHSSKVKKIFGNLQSYIISKLYIRSKFKG